MKTHRHWYGIPSFKTGFLGFVSLLLPVFAPVFLFFLALDVLIWYCWTIETKDAIFRFNEGVLARHNYWIPLEEIQSAVVDQTLVGRLLGFGTLTLIGVSGSSLMLDYVPSPRQWQEALSPRGA